jgi:hypothetical protein
MMTKEQRNAAQDKKLTLRASQNARDMDMSRLGQRNAQRYLDAHSGPLHNWSAIGQAIMGAVVILLFLYFLFA